ncbi:unnamed protein product [Cochlearia groenlandica]
MKIQPIDNDFPANRDSSRVESSKPILKSRLKRLLDKPFSNVLRISNSEKPFVSAVSAESQYGRYGVSVATEFEPSSVALAKMVRNYMEENSNNNNNNEKQSNKILRNRCNCFNGSNNDDSSDEDEFDFYGDSSYDAYEHFNSLIQCGSVAERNLLADAARIAEKSKSAKRKDDLKKIVDDGLSSLGYDSSICKSKWDKTRFIPAGEYEYIDVIIDGERFIIDVDFRSEFEIARQTNAYKALLQSLPFVFVGKPDRIRQIATVVSEAAKQSLKKKGMHFPPWRKADYMIAKWLSAHTRVSDDDYDGGETPGSVSSAVIEPELVFEERILSPVKSSSSSSSSTFIIDDVAEPVERETKAVTGLASLFKEKP